MKSSFSANGNISTTRHGHGVFGVTSFKEQVVIRTPLANGVRAALLQHYIHDLALHGCAISVKAGMASQKAGRAGLHYINIIIPIGF